MKNGFVQLGDVSLTKGSLAWSTPFWRSDGVTIKFDVIVNSELTEEWHNLFHMTTTDANCCDPGDRVPVVLANRDKYFYLSFGINGKGDYAVKYHYNLNQLYNIEFSQNKNSNGEAVYKISVDGTIFHEVINTTPKNFQSAKLYLSSPWSASFAPHGTLSNLKIICEPSKLESGD